MSRFQAGDSSVLIELLEYMYTILWRQILDQGKDIRVVFSDICKAFDWLLHKGLPCKLRNYELCDI